MFMYVSIFVYNLCFCVFSLSLGVFVFLDFTSKSWELLTGAPYMLSTVSMLFISPLEVFLFLNYSDDGTLPI